MLYPVTVNTCARHAHLSEEHMFALFGHKQPTLLKPLMQPGQYAGQEQILLIGPNGKSLKARVLGPSRDESQIERALLYDLAGRIPDIAKDNIKPLLRQRFIYRTPRFKAYLAFT